MLTDTQMQEAIQYNKRQGYCDSEIKLVQRTVQATEDGKWGPQTVGLVAVWQPTHSLVADGKVGPSTWDAIKSCWELVSVEQPDIQIGCGLAAYDQTWPGHSPEEAMQKAWDQALEEGCTEIRYWSSEWLINETFSYGGNKGNSYSGPWLESQTVPEGVVVGAWIDDPVHDAKKAAFADHLKRMHITRAALMINKSNTRQSDVPWSLRWKREDLEEVASLYRARGISCLATCWPRPSRSQIDTMLADMTWVLPLIGARAFEVDTEGNWTTKFLDGFSNMKQAAEYLYAGMRAVAGPEAELELTTYTYHTENSKTAVLAPLMDRLLPQAYSVRHRSRGTVDWTGSLGPGKHQTLAVNRARQAAASE